MKISIGCDHRGYELKHTIITTFSERAAQPLEWVDVGAYSMERSDYPSFARKVYTSITDKSSEFGILICGSGIGMAIAANRFKGVYAALCWNEEIARIAYEDDGVNVLVLASDFVSETSNIAIVATMLDSWNSKTFKEGRYRQRLEMIDNLAL